MARCLSQGGNERAGRGHDLRMWLVGVGTMVGGQHLAFLPPAHSRVRATSRFSDDPTEFLESTEGGSATATAFFFRGKGGEGLEAPSLAADFRPW